MEKRKMKQSDKTKYLVELAVLTAIVLILQLFGIAVKLPFLATSVSLVLIPIALGGMLLGPMAGLWLGLVFGLTVYIAGGVLGGDYFTATLFQEHPFFTFLTCTVKSTAAGYLSGLVYRALHKKNGYVASFTAAAVTPIVNTALFILLALTMTDTLKAHFAEEGTTVFYFLFIGCAGINFVFELLINLIFAPSIYRVIEIIKARTGHL